MDDVLLALVDADIEDEVARCAAAAGYRMVAGRADRCRREWLQARVVAADRSALTVLAGLDPPRRPGVVAVTRPDEDTGDGAVWRLGLTLGAEGGYVLPDDAAGLVSALTGLRLPVRHRAGAVAVIGGHGGAGASTLAAATALVAARRGATTVLFDVDDLGAGLDLVVGIEQRAGLRWPDLALETGTVAGGALRSALPMATDGLAVLAPDRSRGEPLAPETVLAALDAARGNGDVAVVDLPRRAGPLTSGVLESVDLAVLVTTATITGVAAARKTAATLLVGTEASVAVRGPAPSGLRADDVAEAIGLPLLAGYRAEPRLAARVDAGRLDPLPRSPLGRTAGIVCDRIEAVTEPAVAA